MESSEEDKLAQMVHEFMESDPPRSSPACHSAVSLHQQTLLLLQGILGNNTDAEMEVLDKALKYVGDSGGDGDEWKQSKLKKRVMMRLRMDGYNASLCRTSWVSSIDCPGGDYEYIDILMSGGRGGGGATTRVIVDIDFRSQFELARPTSAYEQLAGALPPVFMGKEEKLKRVVSLMCSAAEQSLRERGLHVPPWRRSSYMQSKWLSGCQKPSAVPYVRELTELETRHNNGGSATARAGRDAGAKRPNKASAGLSSQFSDLSINCCPHATPLSQFVSQSLVRH